MNKTIYYATYKGVKIGCSNKQQVKAIEQQEAAETAAKARDIRPMNKPTLDQAAERGIVHQDDFIYIRDLRAERDSYKHQRDAAVAEADLLRSVVYKANKQNDTLLAIVKEVHAIGHLSPVFLKSIAAAIAAVEKGQ